ncbi:hypothetical protein Tco_1384031 [Tanacetum coccineum]
MASDGNNQDAEYALSKLLQMGTMEDFQREFEMLIKRITIPEPLIKSFYISGLKLDLQCLLLRSNLKTLDKDFSLAHKEHIIEKKIDVILPLQGEFASPEVKGLLDADEDISVDDVSSAIDGVFNIGESNVESIEVRNKFGEFSENKASIEEVVVGGRKVLGVGEDDDLCNVATDGGDDTVESGDISIFNSLIGHGSPRSLQLCGTIGTMEVLIDKEVDKEVQYDVYTLHVLIPFLKRLNDQNIKKKKMKAAMQRRLWDPGIKKKN